jgi:hypothetical protein
MGTLWRRSCTALAQDRDGLRSAELLDIEPLDRPHLGPFAVGLPSSIVLNVRVHTFGKLVVVEGLCCGDRVTGRSAIRYRQRASAVYEIAV